ncbi:MAG TPA: B12-binding domain-containing radical SAM protein [Verrucomicrobiae bacterium]|nr:B12-binding domain-containing radical SAM protein [Verrucomicrobiae bacterium]
MKIDRQFQLSSLDGNPRRKTALLINPPVYDTQYWAEWSQPYGLVRIAALLKKNRYKHIDFYDFMEATPVSGDPGDAESKRIVPKHRIHCDEAYGEQSGPTSKARPYRIEKDGEALELHKYHFGKTWDAFERWVKAKGLAKHPPHEIYIASVMSYWWESTRDLITRLRRLMGKRPRIIIGGIYPSIAPDHAARYTGADVVVAGEVHEANDLWTDLTVYRNIPTYAIITPSRGCPYNCHYCAAKTINNGIQQVRFRSVDDIFAEMKDKHERFGIRDFAFYADFLLIKFQDNLIPLLRKIVDAKKPWRLYAPEGLDTRFLASSQELCDLLKASHFQKIYLPVENVDDDILVSLNRKHVKLKHVVEAAKNIERAGFELRHLDVNGYCLYGLPGESISNVVQTALFVSDVIGSIIPMLFAPVPSTQLFDKYRDYYKQRGWCEPDGMVRDLHLLNGKLFPFLPMNDGSVEDYIDLQRMMFMLNQNYRSKSFSVFGESAVADSFRKVVANFKEIEDEATPINGRRIEAIARMAPDITLRRKPDLFQRDSDLLPKGSKVIR